jgi:hypothetical protein
VVQYSGSEKSNSRLRILERESIMTQQVRRTVLPGSVSFKFLPNYSLWKDGLSRISEFLETDDFTCLVNGESITTTLFEAVLVSPAACGSL